MHFVAIVILLVYHLNLVEALAPPSSGLMILKRKTRTQMSGEVEELEGAILPMKIAIDSQFKLGKSIQWGVLQKDVEDSAIPSEKERKERRATAAKELVNIDDKERTRRKTAGLVGTAFSTVLYSGLLLAGKTSFFTLASVMYIPVAFSLGFFESGRKGLWNVAQGGIWDVEGAGMRKIKDINIANALLAKTNQMNFDICKQAVGLVALIALAPSAIQVLKGTRN
jgi:hypothetical protein